MSARLDLALRKNPGHEEGIRLLASRDPSKNLKYLDWGAKMLTSGQALAPEIADILDLFHQFNGRVYGARRNQRIHRDVHAYRPQDLAILRDNLLKIKRTTDRKRSERERLYRIEGEVEADIVYDSDDLIVRHIKNKQASVHYGHHTKWCISMTRDGYFEDYETNNATFFFFERKIPIGDEFDKVALLLPRSGGRGGDTVDTFTSLDIRVDMIALVKVYGVRVFDIFRMIYERSEQYPGSAIFQVYTGNATREQIEAVFENVVKEDVKPYEVSSILQAICCNDAAPRMLLEEIVHRASALSVAASKRLGARKHRRGLSARDLSRAVTAAAVIHPNLSADVRERLIKDLRRRHVDIETIRRSEDEGRVAVEYEMSGGRGFTRLLRGRYHRRRHWRRQLSVSELRKRAKSHDRAAVRMRKQARTLQRKLTTKKKAASRKRRSR